MIHLIAILLTLATPLALGSANPDLEYSDSELTRFSPCKLVPTEWADGDSFRVEFPDGSRHTLRLYGVDCMELHVSDDTDARRLRAQRRYFGISRFGGDTRTSVRKAKALAQDAAQLTRQHLQSEFTVYTAMADARGDGKHKRIYAFVETAQAQDLGDILVTAGMARAFGVNRSRYDGMHRDEHEQHLADLELLAAKRGAGVWQFTDWETLPEERRVQRQEEQDLKAAQDGPSNVEARSINPNTAARDELMRLPGIGETLANRIIEGREDGTYRKPQDLARVAGIGKQTISQMEPFLRFD